MYACLLLSLVIQIIAFEWNNKRPKLPKSVLTLSVVHDIRNDIYEGVSTIQNLRIVILINSLNSNRKRINIA
jgi:hypothetical protein